LELKIEKSKMKELYHNKVFLVLIGVVIVAGVGSWEYTGTAEFCSVCHIVTPYYQSWKSGQYLDHRHAIKGVTCDDCHIEPGKNRIMEMGKYTKEGIDYVTGNYPTPLPQANLSKEYCLKCHGTYSELAQKTSNVTPNPHQSHLGEIQCQLCHKSHKPFENYCLKCHKWNFQKQASTSKGLENLKLPDSNIIGGLIASITTLGAVGIVWINRKQ
jgi:cytochrome c nitrite reductase small subunit